MGTFLDIFLVAGPMTVEAELVAVIGNPEQIGRITLGVLSMATGATYDTCIGSSKSHDIGIDRRGRTCSRHGNG